MGAWSHGTPAASPRPLTPRRVQVSFDVKEATAELQRLGLLSQGSGANGSGAGMQVVPPEKAVAKLKEHWGSILTSQLQQPPASNDIDHAIRALEHHKNQTSR